MEQGIPQFLRKCAFATSAPPACCARCVCNVSCACAFYKQSMSRSKKAVTDSVLHGQTHCARRIVPTTQQGRKQKQCGATKKRTASMTSFPPLAFSPSGVTCVKNWCAKTWLQLQPVQIRHPCEEIIPAFCSGDLTRDGEKVPLFSNFIDPGESSCCSGSLDLRCILTARIL